jgi:predicted XRE-type DNA-binding protein
MPRELVKKKVRRVRRAGVRNKTRRTAISRLSTRRRDAGDEKNVKIGVEAPVKTSRRKSRIKVEIGSGNVFADLGLPNPEEALAKAEIARRVNLILSTRKLSQAKAGAILGIPQPRVSDLARGRLGKFSLEKLIDFAKRLGNDVEIRIRPSRKPRFEVKAAGA